MIRPVLLLCTLAAPSPGAANPLCEPLWHVVQQRVWDRPSDPFNHAGSITGMSRTAAMRCLTDRGYTCADTTCARTTTDRESTADILFGLRPPGTGKVFGPRTVRRWQFTVTFPDALLTHPDHITGTVDVQTTTLPWYRSKHAAQFGDDR